jgi:hypothetical protein
MTQHRAANVMPGEANLLNSERKEPTNGLN